MTDGVNSGLKRNRIPTASVAIASVLAKWFEQIIRSRRIVPNMNGEYVFAVLRSEFERNTNRDSTSNELRKALGNYGYKIRINRSEVIITKFR